MDENLEISDAAQYQAFGHPLRQRILLELGQDPATISQLATTLGSQKGSIAHHLKVLREAGLVQLGHSRRVRGGTEQYYVRTARRFHFAGPAMTAQTAQSLHTLADEIAESPSPPHVVLRRLRLSAGQVKDLIVRLNELAADVSETNRDAPRHAILLGVYELPKNHAS